MKNITFSADDRLVEQARAEARGRNTSLNALFREWLAELADRKTRRAKVEGLFEQMSDFDSGGPFKREDMNAR